MKDKIATDVLNSSTINFVHSTNSVVSNNSVTSDKLPQATSNASGGSGGINEFDEEEDDDQGIIVITPPPVEIISTVINNSITTETTTKKSRTRVISTDSGIESVGKSDDYLNKLSTSNQLKLPSQSLSNNRKTLLKTTTTIKLDCPNGDGTNGDNNNGEDDGILPRIINRSDGLKNSLYYFDENGSPKLRSGGSANSGSNLFRRKTKKYEKNGSIDEPECEIEKKDKENVGENCSCFSFSKLRKKIKDYCK